MMELSTLQEKKQEVITDNGIFNGISWLFDGIQVIHHLSNYNRASSISTSRQDDVIRLHFGLKGDYCFTHQQLNRQFDLIGGHYNMMFSAGFDIVVQNKTSQLETFGVQFPRAFFLSFAQDTNDLLKRFCEAVIEGKNVMLSNRWGVVNPEIESVIKQMIHCRYSGNMKKIFLLSKCLELLVLSVEGCLHAERKQDLYVKSKADKEKLIAVRDLINERLQSPPSLSEVAKSVGLNEYKLKRGFKEMFNNTVFGYMAEQRLNLAYQNLRDTQKTAAEIAFDLGYATPQHFNNAFKKRFGITPHLVRKNP